MTRKYSSAPLGGGSVLGSTTPAETPFPQNGESGNDSFLKKVGANSKVALTTAGAFATLFAANSAASTIDFTQSSYSVGEHSYYAGIGVTLTCQPGEDPGLVSVSYETSNGTAIAGSSEYPTADYTAVSDTLTFTWGDNGSWGTSGNCGETQYFSVPILEDTIVEGNETVNLSLSNGNTAVLTILDNDSHAQAIDFTQSSYHVAENGHDAWIGVTLTCQPGEDPGLVSVSYATSNGTATAGASGDYNTTDYMARSGRLTWDGSGNCGVIRYFYVPILEDTIFEGNETVNLTLSNGNTAVLTILDNEPFDFSSSRYSVNEGAGVATIGVTMSCPSGGNPNSASVSYSSSNGTATAGSSGSGDYTAVNGTLTWGANGCGTTQSFNVPIQEDAIAEGNETVNLSLSNGNTAVLTIIDNEPPLAVRLDYLAATPDNGSIIVEWTTGVEIDSAGFHIWRANMGQFGGYTNINQITTGNMIDAQGNSHSSFDYRYVDHDVVFNTIYYYALEEVDSDAQSTYHLDYIVSGTAK